MSIDQDRLLRSVEQMPTFPRSAHRIIELTNDVNCAPRDLVGVIEHDPILTLKVLKLVNSSYFGLASEVTSVKHAVVYLGINTIKNVALSVATIGALPKHNDLGFDMTAFWWHSLLTGALARIMARRHGAEERELSHCFVSGLLHDVGKVVFVQFLPDEYRACLARNDAAPARIEQEVMGFSHAAAGALVAEKWQLPKDLVDCIRAHHSIGEMEKLTLFDCALFCGNQMSKLAVAEQLQEEVVAYEAPPPPVTAWMGGSLESTLASVHELQTEMEKARLFVEMSA